MKYGSVCSGIEAASVAWEPLGWNAAWFSEIEKFPSAVLDHHWPDVPNLGDMLALPDAVASGEVEAPDVLVGGTPCQAFSLAGRRGSLEDERGALTLAFVELANRIDEQRKENGQQESIIVWENVPGVLSTRDNAFGAFLAGLAGETVPLVPTGPRWTNAGFVLGPQRTVAWRVLDAQYFGVAQRRRRVFVVASARDGFDPAEVLFESEGLRRDSPPSREAGEDAAADAGSGFTPSSFGAYQRGVGTVRANGGDLGGGSETIAAVPVCFGAGNVSGPIDPAATLTAKGQRLDYEVETFAVQPAIAFSAKDYKDGTFEHVNSAGPLTTSADRTRGAPIAMAFQERGRTDGRSLETNGDLAYALTAPNGGGRAQERNIVDGNRLAVRRLTPVECERLQGFPDNWTRIPWRNKAAEDCPDGPRYKAIGNSMAVPVMAWIGQRIDSVVGH